MANEKRLIDANVLKSEYEWLLSVVNPCSKNEIRDAIERIEKAPTVDAVEVVRCKDCKYREKSPWHDGYRCGNPCDGMASGVEIRDDDFCSYGERKDNG